MNPFASEDLDFNFLPLDVPGTFEQGRLQVVI